MDISGAVPIRVRGLELHDDRHYHILFPQLLIQNDGAGFRAHRQTQYALYGPSLLHHQIVLAFGYLDHESSKGENGFPTNKVRKKSIEQRNEIKTEVSMKNDIFEQFFRIPISFVDEQSNEFIDETISVGVLSNYELKSPYPKDPSSPGEITDDYPDVYIVFAHEAFEMDGDVNEYPQIVAGRYGFLLKISPDKDCDTRLVGFSGKDPDFDPVYINPSYEYVFMPYFGITMYIMYRDPVWGTDDTIEARAVSEFIQQLLNEYKLKRKLEHGRYYD